jgi:hypothetical protein
MASLQRKANGSYALRSKSHVRAALDELAECDRQADILRAKIEKKCATETSALGHIADQRGALKSAIDAYVLDHDEFETDTLKITRVQAHRRTWNIDTLAKIVPRGIFKNIVKMTVDPAKIDALVKEGRLDSKKIAPAYVETPNAAYVKWTEKSDTTSGADEADALADALA